MYKLITLKDIIRIPPTKFNEPLEKVSREILEEKYTGMIIPNIGFVVSIINVKVSSTGKIIPRDATSHNEVEFDALVYSPVLNEIVEGEVIMVEDIGIFVRLGPVDGFVHKSQVGNDLFNYDIRQAAVIGTKTKRIIRKGDRVRARIISIGSKTQRTRELRIGLTMRQPFLGKLEWIEEDIKRIYGKK